MNNKLQIIGGSGHAKVAIQTARAAGYEPVAVYDDNTALFGKLVCGVPVQGRIADAQKSGFPCLIAIGSNEVRKKLVKSLDCDWATIIHPTAVVDPTVQIGQGTVIFAGSVIQVDSHIGHHVIVNTSASIDHDCLIGDFSHIAPGCHLCGAVRVGEWSLLGVGTCVKPLMSIGNWSILGAGASVASNIPDHVTAVGVPAKVMRKINDEQNKRVPPAQ